MVSGRRRWRRSLSFLLLYLLIVMGAAIVLWLFIPEDVKKAIRETYFNSS